MTSQTGSTKSMVGGLASRHTVSVGGPAGVDGCRAHAPVTHRGGAGGWVGRGVRYLPAPLPLLAQGTGHVAPRNSGCAEVPHARGADRADDDYDADKPTSRVNNCFPVYSCLSHLVAG